MGAIEDKISREIHRFDLFSLMALLNRLGYPYEQIRFRSHQSSSSQPCMIQGIEYRESPPAAGDHFRQPGTSQRPDSSAQLFHEEDGRGHDRCRHLCRFYRISGPSDHSKVHPEHLSRSQSRPVSRLAGSPSATLPGCSTTGACSTLHWLFQLVFPELGVSAEKAVPAAQPFDTSCRSRKKQARRETRFFGKKDQRSRAWETCGRSSPPRT